MGRDKALLPFTGRPLIEHALSILHEAGLSTSIAGARSPLIEEFAPVVEDAEPGLGPLAGVCAAIAATAAEFAVFLPVDLPLLPPSLIVYLLHHARITGQVITIPTINGFPQTFPAVLHRSVLAPLNAALSAGRRGCFSAFQAAAASFRQSIRRIDVEFLVQSGHVDHPSGLPPSRWFLNLNDMGNLAKAEAVVSKHIA
jgi:molybdopterin-guanine dinucleotide biosynthesis protein A